MRWNRRPTRPSNASDKGGIDAQRGAAAVEFALVFPLFIFMMGAVFTFSLACLGRQLLSNIASETTRACVLRSAGGASAVTGCAQSVGQYLVNTMPNVCFTKPVSLQIYLQALPQQNFPSTLSYPEAGQLLVVKASCAWDFAPASTVVVAAGTTFTAPNFLQAVSAMPFTLQGG